MIKYLKEANEIIADEDFTDIDQYFNQFMELFYEDVQNKYLLFRALLDLDIVKLRKWCYRLVEFVAMRTYYISQEIREGAEIDRKIKSKIENLIFQS